METQTILEDCAKRAMDPNTSPEDREREIRNLCNIKKVEDDVSYKVQQSKAERNRYIIDTTLKVVGAVGTTALCAFMTYLGIGIELENSHWIPTVKDSMKNFKLKMPK